MIKKLIQVFVGSLVCLSASQVYGESGPGPEFPCQQFLGGEGIKLKARSAGNAQSCTVSLSQDVLDSIANITKLQDQINSIKDQNGNKLSASQEGAVMYDDPNIKNTVTLNPGGAGTIITNVTAGTIASGSKDAVNGDQLWQTENKLKDSINKAKTIVTAGNNIKVTTSVNADGHTEYQVSTADNVNFNKVVVGSVTIDKTKTDKTGNTIISGVGDGSLIASSKDAVNGGQLNKVAGSIAAHLGGGSKFDPESGVVTPPKYTIQGNDYNNVGDAMMAINSTTNKIINGEIGLIKTDGKITTIDKEGTSTVINVAGKNGDRVISGVAPGINPNDAVNKAQLDNKFASVNNQIKRLDTKIEDTRKAASQGIASSIAMNIDFPSQHPGEFATGFGMGTYDGETSLAVGLNYLANNGKIKISGGIGHALGSDAKPAGKIGVSFVW
jgi:autotransporter adhesin